MLTRRYSASVSGSRFHPHKRPVSSIESLSASSSTFVPVLYLQGLNDKIPELYQLALDKYSREGDGLYKRYSVLSAQEGQDYGRHQDSLNRYQQSWENAFRLYQAGVETPEVLGILGIPVETGDDGGSSSIVRRRSNNPEEPEEPEEPDKKKIGILGGGGSGGRNTFNILAGY